MALPTAIMDFAYNILAASSWAAQAIGWTDQEDSEVLNLDMYHFIPSSVREEDRKNGLVLKRYLEGPQAVWLATQIRIFQILDFWDISKVENEFLKYVQTIVGWTGKLTKITDALDDDTLRRLISTSVALWKRRGPEDTLIDVLTLTTKTQSRIFNWFYFRWLLDVGQLTEDHVGNDIHLIDLPGAPDYYEYNSNLRIVDDGTLDRTLVKDIIKLMRPISERYTISYLTFMDLFSVDGDKAKWTEAVIPVMGPDYYTNLIVEDGVGHLIDDTIAEEIYATEGLNAGWLNQIAYFKIKVTVPGGPFYTAGIMFRNEDGDGRSFNFRVSLDPVANAVNYWEIYGGPSVKTNLATVDYSPWGVLYMDQWHSIRIDTQHPNLKIYVDNNLVIENPGCTNTGGGTIGFYHDVGCKIEFDEVEMFLLPLETDEININET